MSRPCAAMAASVKRSASAPYSSISSSGSMTLPFDFDIFGAALVAHQRVDVDGRERHLLHEVQPHHHHARDPEEDDVEAGDEHVGRVIALQLRRLVGPAERRERPQRRGEPGVEHVLVAVQILVGKARAPLRIGGDVVPLLGRDLLDVGVVRERVGDRIVLVLGDEDFAVRPVPGRNLVAPPDLARDAPGLDVLHPVEERRLPLLRHETVRRSRTAVDRRLRQRLGVDVPLIGEIRLDHRAGAVAMRHAVAWSARSCRAVPAPRAARRSSCARRSDRGRAAPASRRARPTAVRHQETPRCPRDRACPSTSSTLTSGRSWRRADLEIVEVVRRRDLHRAGALLRVGVLVGDDRDAAADQRQDRGLADQMPVGARSADARRPRCRRAWSPAASSRPRRIRRCPRSDS